MQAYLITFFFLHAFAKSKSDVDILMNELESCGIDSSKVSVSDVNNLLPSLPSVDCENGEKNPLLNTDGFMVIDHLFSDRAYPQKLHSIMMNDIDFSPSTSHIAESLNPRTGGDGHRIPSYNSGMSCWGREAIKNSRPLEALSPRHQLWNNFVLKFQKIDSRVVAHTDILFKFFPPMALHRVHQCGGSGSRQHLLYKLMYFVHNSTAAGGEISSIRIHQIHQNRNNHCSHTVDVISNRLLVLDCSKIEMEILPIGAPRYFILNWLRGTTGFGVP
jgi:hypothetical protein